MLAGAWGAGTTVPAPAAVTLAGALGLTSAALARAGRASAMLPLLLAFFLVGAAAPVLAPPARPPEAGRGLVLEGVVLRAPDHLPDADRVLVDLEAAAPRRLSPLAPCSGRARVTISRAGGRAAEGKPIRPGDRIRVLARTRRPEGPAFPGDPGEERALRALELDLLAFVSSPAEVVVVAPGGRGGLGVAIERLRDHAHLAIDRLTSAEVSPLIRAFATGDRSGLPRELEERFAASGLAHLLAVSGLNLAIVAGLFLLGVERALRRVEGIALGPGAARVAALLAVPCVAFYTAFVGGSPSAVRAALVVLVLAGAHLLGRSRDAWAALAACVLTLAALDPDMLEELSFQLSLVAVVGLLVLYRPILRLAGPLGRAHPLVRWPVEVAAASTAATLATAPLIAGTFGRLSLVGIAANIPAHPLSTLVLVPASLAGALASLVADRLARPFFYAAERAAVLLAGIATTSAALPGATIRVGPPTAAEVVTFAAALLCFAKLRGLRGLRGAIAAAVVIAAPIAAHFASARRPGGALTVTFLPVGQGDAAVVELPEGEVLVVDTGPGAVGRGQTAGDRVVARFLEGRRIRRIDRLVLTHAHADHTGGLAALAARFEVGEVWWAGDLREGPPELEAELAGLPVRAPPLGAEQLGGARLEVLGPVGPAAAWPTVNDGSIVLSVTYGARTVLFTGDAELGAEAALLDRCARCLSADVLKLGHHGSRTSSSEPFLEAVRPTHAIASVGPANHFGFPHPEVVARLKARGVSIFRTDRDGAVTVTTDGRSLAIEPFRRTLDAAPPPG